MTAQRFVGMGEWPEAVRLVGVANKVASDEDEAYVRTQLTQLGVPLWATIPMDPAVQRAERNGEPLISLHREASARLAVAGLADRLCHATSEPVGTALSG